MAQDSSLTLGASYLGNGSTRFRVWAPVRSVVEVQLDPGAQLTALRAEGGGYFSGVAAASPGSLYRYRLDGGPCLPDPCSRFQPQGPHGPSEVVDPAQFHWTDAAWGGPEPTGQVLYELHVGTFSDEGSYDGVARRLADLKELGITCLELMPVGAFPGQFNWGYDGVDLFAPCAVYGRPDALRALVNEAHRQGLGVVLDVVYNHLGPDGNYLKQFAPAYFSSRYPAEWGEPTNFDGEGAAGARDFFVQNACHWIAEYHFDGLRLDAAQNLFDHSTRHIIAEIAQSARQAADGRRLLLFAEHEAQEARVIGQPATDGHGLDGLWIDDFHHCCRVAATGEARAYCSDYRGSAHELLACTLYNSLYQGQRYRWQDKSRGSPLLDVPKEKLVFYLQNHDQVANSLRGLRLHQLTSPSVARALTTYFLLLPQTPLLFMGQEFFCSSPFLYFVDHAPELQAAVQRGRTKFLSQFPHMRHAFEHEHPSLPIGVEARRLSTLDWNEARAPEHLAAWTLHRELLALRRLDPLLSGSARQRLDGAALGSQALVLRYRGCAGASDRLLVLNLGVDLSVDPCPQPLVAPPPGQSWRLILSSEEYRFGGQGALLPLQEGRWTLPGHCAVLLSSADEGSRG